MLTIMVLAGFAKNNELKSENNDLKNTEKEGIARKTEMEDLLKADEMEIIERHARDKLGFGEKDQTVYYNIAGD